MARTFRRSLLVLVLAFAVLPGSASAAEPPWCGTPEADFSSDVLADGTDPADPAGSFPHVPHYAIGCTLQDIRSRSRGRMSVEVIGKSSLGRNMYGVVINRLRSWDEKRGYLNWLAVRGTMLESPVLAQKLLRRMGDDIKVPILVQGAIHGNEYEGVDSNLDMIEKFATTPYGTDPDVDAILSNTILVWNVIQNPDGRVFGTRENANGFDLNRDYMTQSQPETLASIKWMKRWLAPEMLDLHGYVTPTLIEATTKPHNPSIEYDMWLKWNQPRIDYNEAALAEIGQERHAADQRVVPRGRRGRPGRDLRRRLDPRPRRGRGLGRLGAVLRPDVPPAHRPRLVDRRDVQRRIVRRARRVAPDPERRPGVDVRVRHGEPRQDARGRARDLPPR